MVHLIGDRQPTAQAHLAKGRGQMAAVTAGALVTEQQAIPVAVLLQVGQAPLRVPLQQPQIQPLRRR